MQPSSPGLLYEYDIKTRKLALIYGYYSVFETTQSSLDHKVFTSSKTCSVAERKNVNQKSLANDMVYRPLKNMV